MNEWTRTLHADTNTHCVNTLRLVCTCNQQQVRPHELKAINALGTLITAGCINNGCVAVRPWCRQHLRDLLQTADDSGTFEPIHLDPEDEDEGEQQVSRGPLKESQ
jgi:hypothetical protein